MKNLVIIIFIFIILCILICFNCVSNERIDVVYTWVAEDDPERDHYKKLLGMTDNDTRYRYNENEELKYSIRSLFKHCSEWIGTIYIVVKDGQKPNFIDFSNSRVVLINHSEIIPKFALPTFNSNVIELCIHKIKNLRNRYVYFNDDFFLTTYFQPFKNNKLNLILKHDNRRDINIKGNPNEPYNFQNAYMNTLYYTEQIFGKHINIYLPHTPSVCYKPWEKEMENILIENNLLVPTLSSKFRKNSDIIINNGFRTIFYLTKKNVKIVEWDEKMFSLTHNCSNNISNIYDFINNNKNKPASFNVNIIGKICDTPFKNMMEKIYDTKSPIEK